jgi:hypothetical protein
MDGCPFDPLLVCCVKALSYDFQTKIGTIIFPHMNNCHAPAVIELFKRIHPDCREIHTFAGNEEDACYYLRADGKWHCERDGKITGHVADDHERFPGIKELVARREKSMKLQRRLCGLD